MNLFYKYPLEMSFGKAKRDQYNTERVVQERKAMEGANVKQFMNKEDLSNGLKSITKKIAKDAIEKRGCFSLAVADGVPELLRLAVGGETKDWRVFYAEDDFYGAETYGCSMHKRIHDCLIFIPGVKEYSAGSHSFEKGISPQAAVEWYEQKLKSKAKKSVLGLNSEGIPRFDLIILKLESNGKVAGLLPNHDILEEKTRLVSLVSKENRVTFTLPLINAAANIVICAEGNDAYQALKTALVDVAPHGSNPAQLIQPTNGKRLWFVDFHAMTEKSSESLRMLCGG